MSAFNLSIGICFLGLSGPRRLNSGPELSIVFGPIRLIVRDIASAHDGGLFIIVQTGPERFGQFSSSFAFALDQQRGIVSAEFRRRRYQAEDMRRQQPDPHVRHRPNIRSEFTLRPREPSSSSLESASSFALIAQRSSGRRSLIIIHHHTFNIQQPEHPVRIGRKSHRRRINSWPTRLVIFCAIFISSSIT